ncbi:hypothetical protein CVT25_013240, partial [Psilocybe cyanescens]
DQPWSAQDEQQIRGCAHRHPQKKTVHIFQLLALGTADVLIANMALSKGLAMEQFLALKSAVSSFLDQKEGQSLNRLLQGKPLGSPEEDEGDNMCDHGPKKTKKSKKMARKKVEKKNSTKKKQVIKSKELIEEDQIDTVNPPAISIPEASGATSNRDTLSDGGTAADGMVPVNVADVDSIMVDVSRNVSTDFGDTQGADLNSVHYHTSRNASTNSGFRNIPLPSMSEDLSPIHFPSTSEQLVELPSSGNPHRASQRLPEKVVVKRVRTAGPTGSIDSSGEQALPTFHNSTNSSSPPPSPIRIHGGFLKSSKHLPPILPGYRPATETSDPFMSTNGIQKSQSTYDPLPLKYSGASHVESNDALACQPFSSTQHEPLGATYSMGQYPPFTQVSPCIDITAHSPQKTLLSAQHAPDANSVAGQHPPFTQIPRIDLAANLIQPLPLSAQHTPRASYSASQHPPFTQIPPQVNVATNLRQKQLLSTQHGPQAIHPSGQHPLSTERSTNAIVSKQPPHSAQQVAHKATHPVEKHQSLMQIPPWVDLAASLLKRPSLSAQHSPQAGYPVNQHPLSIDAPCMDLSANIFRKATGDGQSASQHPHVSTPDSVASPKNNQRAEQLPPISQSFPSSSKEIHPNSSHSTTRLKGNQSAKQLLSRLSSIPSTSSSANGYKPARKPSIPVNRVPTAFNTLDTELPPSTAVRAPNPFVAQQKKRAGKQVERG